MKKQKKLILSISLLASNRKETIRKCLDSLKPLMEKIPSELIIVDTGCDEETYQILTEYTSNIVKFEWCQDFSKARNAGLKRAKGEWFLFIDDDEWFEDVDDIVKFFKSGNYKKHGYANYIQRNYLDSKGENYTDTWVSRMVRLTKDIHFESKIHEYMEPIRGSCAGINSYVHHYGYVYKNEEEKMNHFKRNEVLLREMKEAEPENMRWWVQLAQEYRSVMWNQELLDFSIEALEKFVNINNFADNLNIGTFYIAMIASLVSLKRHDDALKACTAAFQDKRNSEMCRAFVNLYAAEIYLRTDQYPEAERHVLEYFRLFDFLEKEKGMMFVQKTALLVNEAFDSMMMRKAYSIAICSGLKQKNTFYLKKYLPKMEWEKRNVYLLDIMFPILIEAIAVMPEEDIFIETVSVVAKHPGLWEQMYVALKQWELKKKKGYENVVKVLAKVDVDNEYLRSMQLQHAILEGDQDTLEEKYEELFQKTANVFDLSDEMWMTAEKYHVPLEKYFLRVPFSKWKLQLRDFMANTLETNLQRLKKRMQSIRSEENRRYDYFDMRVTEAELLFRKKWDDLAACRQQLRDFADRTITFNGYYYKEETLTQLTEFLPQSLQAALWLEKALEAEETDWDKTKEYLKQCASVYHNMAHAVKEFIRLYGEEQIQKERKAREAREELCQLTRKLKEKIRELLQKGMAAEASGVVEQLKQLLPEDLEVVTLSLQVKLQLLQSL